jgi:hypothetical protein
LISLFFDFMHNFFEMEYKIKVLHWFSKIWNCDFKKCET